MFFYALKWHLNILYLGPLIHPILHCNLYRSKGGVVLAKSQFKTTLGAKRCTKHENGVCVCMCVVCDTL